MDHSTPAATATGNHREAHAIREDFYAQIAQITDAAGGTWTYLDGTAFSPEDRGSFSPKECASAAGSRDARQLLLLLTSDPSTDGPAEIERLKAVLEDRGMQVTGYIPGKTRREVSSVDAQSPTGQFVSYGTNDERTTIRFGSECSADPSMLRDLD